MKAKESQFPESEHNGHPHGSEWTVEALEAYKRDLEDEPKEVKEAKKGKLPNSYLPPNAAPF